MLLTVGFGLGYVKALYDVPAIQDNLVTLIQLLKDESKERSERAETADNTDENDNAGNTSQGETPS
jgi:hypothetical protein